MKPDDGVEFGARAWNRWVVAHKKKKGWFDDHELPIRLRGYSEVQMKELTKKERKAIDSSLRRGYTLSQSPMWGEVLNVLLKSQDFALGYMGKTRASLWFPNQAARDDCMKHAEAQLVMTERFSANNLYVRGAHTIIINVSCNWDETLKAHLSELRTVVDEHMALWKEPRIAFADRLLPDDAVVRVPFDTFKGKPKDE